jgi:hypothetical protein
MENVRSAEHPDLRDHMSVGTSPLRQFAVRGSL